MSTAPPAGGTFFEDGRIHLVLGWPHLAVAGVILLVALVVAFQVGKRSAQPPAQDSGDLSGILANKPAPETPPPRVTTPPKPGQGRSAGPVVTPLSPSPEPPPSVKPQPARPTPAATQPAATPPKTTPPAPVAATPPKTAPSDEEFSFEANSYYVVVQHFRTRDRDRATAARDFLVSKGVACVVRPGGGDLELVAKEEFPAERQAQDLVRRILEFGKEYRNAGGGYDFASAKARKF